MDRRAEVDDLRRDLSDCHAVAEALGLLKGQRGRDWTRNGRGVLVLCPAHGERTPSCGITPGPDGTLRFHCFGCAATGDVLHLVALVEGLSMTAFADVLDAARALARRVR